MGVVKIMSDRTKFVDILGKTRTCAECWIEIPYEKGFKCNDPTCVLCKHVFTCSIDCHNKRVQKLNKIREGTK